MTENKMSHDHMADRTLHAVLYGLGVLSLYTVTWTSSDVLTRNLKR